MTWAEPRSTFQFGILVEKTIPITMLVVSLWVLVVIQSFCFFSYSKGPGMDSPSQSQWKGPGGPRDEPGSPLLARRPPRLSLPPAAASGDGKRATPNGPRTASPRTTLNLGGRSPSSCEEGGGEDATSPTSTERQRYERLREEAAKQGMKMLEEEKQRNSELTGLLKAQIDSLERELEGTRSRLGKKVGICML